MPLHEVWNKNQSPIRQTAFRMSHGEGSEAGCPLFVLTACDHGKYLNDWESSVSGKREREREREELQASLTLKEDKKGDLFYSTLFILTRETNGLFKI